MTHASSGSPQSVLHRRVLWFFLITGIVFLVIAGGGIVAYAAGFVGKAFPVGVALEATSSQPLSVPVTLHFSVPVLAKEAEAAIRLSPKTAFSVRATDPASVSGYASVIEIIPDGRFVPETDYTVSVDAITSLSGARLRPVSYRFTTLDFPSVVSLQPADGQDVEIDQPVQLAFADLSDDFDVRVTLDPPADLTEVRAGNVLTFTPQTPFVQGQLYTVHVRAAVKGAVLQARETQTSFTTRGPISLASVSPKDGDPRAPQVGPVTLTFDRPVQHEGIENFVHIQPEVEGTYTWVDETTLAFQPKEYFPEGVSYVVTVDPALQAREGSSHAADGLKFSFKTRYANGRQVHPPVDPAVVMQGRSVVVDIRTQSLYAYDNGVLVNAFLISSGIYGLDTPLGDFKITLKRPIMRYTWNYGPDNPLNYDLPNVKWNMDMSGMKYWLHGAYWHNNFGHRMSHGCVNIHTLDAEWLYGFTDIGTPVHIYMSKAS